MKIDQGSSGVAKAGLATFYPKMIADVTTGSTTTAQTLFNPLPAENCDCGNNCC